jgi:hypothetical protein
LILLQQTHTVQAELKSGQEEIDSNRNTLK